MPVALKNKIDLISPDFLDMLNDYVEYLVFKSQERKQSTVSNRIGVAKGVLNVPDDIDADNAEIAKMFGV